MPRSSLADLGLPRTVWLPRRYVLAIVAFFGFANLYALRVNMSVGIVAMTSNKTVIINGTQTIVHGEFEWDSVIQGVVLSSFFYGYIMTQIVGGWLFCYLGGKTLIGWGIFFASVLTLFTPIFARMSVYVLVFSRVLTGLFEGLVFPSMHGMWSKWAPPDERSRLVTISYSGCYFGTVAALPICGALADRIGWPSIFYFLGIVGILWTGLWYFTVSDSPTQDKRITQEEKDYIEDTLGASGSKVRAGVGHSEVPWKKILTSVPAWAIVVAHFTENWGFYTLLTELPTFLNDVFNYNMQNSGLLAALPYLVLGIIVQSAGFVADWLRANGYMTTTAVRKLFTCGGFVTRSFFLLVAAHSVSVGAIISALTIGVGFGGYAFAGYAVNQIDIAPQYASLLMGISNTIATLPGILSPVLTGKIVQHKSPAEWQVVFHISSILYIVGAIFYGIFASGKIQSWAAVEPENASFLSSDNERSSTDDLLPVGGGRYQSVSR